MTTPIYRIECPRCGAEATSAQEPQALHCPRTDCPGIKTNTQTVPLPKPVSAGSGDLLREFAALACNLNQLLVGWHADGTAWSEWDQQQLDALISLQIRVEAYLRYATAGSGLREVIETAMLKCGLTVTPGLSNAVLAAVESHNRGIIWQNHDTLAQERDALAAKVAQEKAHHEFYQGKVLAYMGAEIEWQKKCTALRERVAGLEKALDWALNSMNPPFDWEEFKRASTLIGIRDCTTPAALAAVDARKEGEK